MAEDFDNHRRIFDGGEIFKVMFVRILSESSAIRLAKTRKNAGLQRSKTLDIS
jgi:hypothetical protein